MHIGCWKISKRRPLWRPRLRWKNNIEMDLLKKHGGGVEGSVMN